MIIKLDFIFGIILIACMNVFSQIDPGDENLTHSWTFDDGTATDMVGAEGNTMGSAQILQGALNTTESDSWLSLPADSIAINTYAEVTIETWFQSVPNGNTGFTMLVSFGNTQNTFGTDYFFMTAARADDVSRTAISCGDANTPWSSETGANGVEYDDGTVHHMVSTLDSTSITLYIDGELQTTTPLDSNNRISEISPLYAYLAKSLYDSDPTWRGYIHEFNIYNKALTADNVLYLFENGKNTFHWVGEEALKPVVVEAESGNMGSDFSVLQDDSVGYVMIESNATAFNPVSGARMISYEVTFPDTGTYDLFARLRVGPNTDDDDSFFYGNGFGEKDSSENADWIFINGLATAGFSEPNDVVRDPGGLGAGMWKWVNLSRNAYQGDTSIAFTVVNDSLTQTFQIGAREDGLDIDKLAFGKSYLYYTVENLDNREIGSAEIPAEMCGKVRLWLPISQNLSGMFTVPLRWLILNPTGTR
ncbi:MAG: LamG domain-containing protein [candidate division KSB1 bacterium]|nr:LamG domain-containing protein [candidate division KSB1 bacterium]